MSELVYGLIASAIVATIAIVLRILNRTRDINYILRKARPLSREALECVMEFNGTLEATIAYFLGSEEDTTSLYKLRTSAATCVSKLREIEEELAIGITRIQWDDPRDRDKYSRHQQNVARSREFLDNSREWFRRWSWSHFGRVMITRADLYDPECKNIVDRGIKLSQSYLELSRNELEPSIRWFSRDKIFFSDEQKGRR